MRRKMRKKGKVAALMLSVVVAASAFLVGTYAWRSVSQQAPNEAKGNLNPGGRLHDDFNGLNPSSTLTGSTDNKVKYVYVENFTDSKRGDNIYARIRLQEYLEKGVGAGKASNDASKEATSIVAGKTIENKADWTPYLWDNAPTFRNYVTLGTGGQTDYLPTFNKDRDSLEADINGTLAGPDKSIETTADDYEDYEAYTAGTSKRVSIGIYDASGDGLDKVKEAGLDVETIIAAVRNSVNGRFNVTPLSPTINIAGISCTVTQMEPDTLTVSSAADDIEAIHLDLDPQTTGGTAVEDIILKVEEHTAATTLDTDPSLDATNTPGIISMKDWDALPTHKKCGNFWVYDSEGWLYWANPIEPETATGCLLNSIAVNDTKPEGSGLAGEEYYYGLNVVAQFATAGDWGEAQNQTGFYKDGLTPEGKKLLDFVSNPLDPEDIYGVAVTLKDPTQVVTQGSKVAFLVTVTDKVTGKTLTTDAADVRWEIERGGKGKTVTIHDTAVDENGILTIAENEADTAVTVKAIYQYDADEPTHTVEGSFTIDLIDPLAYSVTVKPEETTAAAKGHSVQLSAEVTKTVGATTNTAMDGTLTWKVSNADDEDTSLAAGTKIDANGKLQIDAAEPAVRLKVTAVYTVDYENSSGVSLGNKEWSAEKVLALESYRMDEISVQSGKAEPDTDIVLKTTVYKADAAGTIEIRNGIQWSFQTKGNDSKTTLTAQQDGTATLHIGADERSKDIVVTASYQDSALGSELLASQSYQVGEIATTAYEILVSRDYTADLVQGDTVTFTGKVRKSNGTQASTYVENPAIDWGLSRSKSGTSLTDVSTSVNTEVKKKLTVGVSEKETVKLTAAFQGASTVTIYNKAIQQLTYNVALSGGSSSLVQEDTGNAYTVTVTNKNGRNANAKVALSSSNLTWTVATPENTATKMTGQTYGTGTATAKLTVAATESKTAVTVKATYKDTVNNQTYDTAGSNVNIAKSTYQITTFNLGATAVAWGGNTSISLVVKKMNGIGAPKVVANGANASGVTWAYTGRANGATQVTGGKLVVASGETAKTMTLKPTYKAANGATATTAAKTINYMGTPEQVAVYSAKLGEKVTIGDLEYWKIYAGKEKGTNKDVILMWQTEPEKDYVGKSFGTSPKWESSIARNYLGKNGAYVNSHSTIKAMIKAEIIPETTIYTRGAYNDKSDGIRQTTKDYIFLLSEADLDGTVCINREEELDTLPASWEYTTFGMIGNGTKLLDNIENKDVIRSSTYDWINWSWLRSPRFTEEHIAFLRNSGIVAHYTFDDTSTDISIRPAFWMYL